MSRARKSAKEAGQLKLGDLLEEFDERLGARPEPEILTLTEKMGFISQLERFNKRLAIADTSNYKVIGLHDIAFNPYLLWADAIAQNTQWKTAIISPLYPTFRVREGYSPSLVNYLLSGGFLSSSYDAISHGSVPRKRRATVKDFLNLQIYMRMPPLAEQERLVELLDEATELRKLRVQADRRTATLIPALFHDMFGDGQSFPTKPLIELVDASRGISYGVVQRGSHFPKGVPLLRISDFGSNAVNPDKLVSVDPQISNKYKRTILNGGELVVSIRGTVGRVAIVPEKAKGWNVAREVAVIPLLPEFSRPFLHSYMLSAFAQDFITNKVRGIAQRGINLEDLRRLPVPMPPPMLQKEFAERVSEALAMQAEQATSRHYLDELFQSMLHRMFRGELVPNDGQEFRLTAQPLETPDPSHRAAIACYIVDRLHASPTFGRTQLMKGLYLAETYAQVQLHGEYERQAAGPFDKAIYDIEDEAQTKKWFAARETRTQLGHSKISYAPLKGIKKKVADAVTFLGKRREKFDHVLALIKKRTTKDVEILTTLYAVWNDLLIAGCKPTDDKLVHEVLENWHEDKRTIPEARWRKEIKWMKENSFIPTGIGRSTRQMH